jgi:hypothetical protein
MGMDFSVRRTVADSVADFLRWQGPERRASKEARRQRQAQHDDNKPDTMK